MQDYDFGNYLYHLRLYHRLLQKELGAEVGVSNKAISKWENGVSRPQMKTLHKLARLYNLSVDDLLCMRMPKCEFSEGRSRIMRHECLKIAHDRMVELYGEHPPIEAVERFEEEKAYFQDDGFYCALLALRKIQKKCREIYGSMWTRGLLGGSYLAWLVGATHINPLAPHYYCPRCQTIEFVPDVYSGWDLPVKTCACGARMEEEGQRLPLQLIRPDEADSVEVNVPGKLMPYIYEILQEHYQGIARVYECHYTEDEGQEDNWRLHYVLLEDGDPLQKHVVDGVIRLGFEQFHIEFDGKQRYSFFEDNLTDAIQRRCEQIGIEPVQIDIQEKDLLHNLITSGWMTEHFDKGHDFREDRPTLSSVLKQYPCHQFSDLLRVFGMLLSTYDEGVAEQMLASDERIAFREDVYDHVIEACQSQGVAGTALAAKVAEMTRKGRYSAKFSKTGVDVETRGILQSIGIAPEYIRNLEHTWYLFPKAHVIELIRMYLLVECLSGGDVTFS